MITLELPDPSLILLIGPAGAGKSTFAARHFLPTEVVSSDRCRGMVCDDQTNQGISRYAFDLLHHITRLRLALNRLTVIDATNLKAAARRRLLNLADPHQIPSVAIIFDLSLETCLAQNLSRPDRVVNPGVIRQHIEELSAALAQIPLEGFKHVYRLDRSDPVIRIERILKY